MKNSSRLISTIVLAGIISACSSPPPPQPVEVVQQQYPQNQEVLRAFSDMAEIKEELKQLRNAVENIQFETENAKRRQQDLFQDLDRRLVSFERNQQVLSPQTDDSMVDDADSDQVTVDDPGADSSGLASQVVVVSSDTDSGATQDTDQGSDGGKIGGLSAGSSTVSSTESRAVTLQEQEAYDAAFELLKQSRYEDAILQFQEMADTWPNSQLADDSYYWMSEARYVNREFEHALSGFRTVVSRYPDSQRVPEALLKIGYIQYDIGAYEDAAETFRDILARFPGHQVTVSAQTRLRRIEQTIQ